jgi:hypothetical protein
MLTLTKAVDVFLKAARLERIKFDDINLDRGGLREESFEFLRPMFETAEGFPQNIPRSAVAPVRIRRIGNELFVDDGRHRLLLAKEFGVHEVPAVLFTMNDEGWTNEYPVIIEMT